MLPSAITRLASLAALFACLAIPALRADDKPAKLNLFNGKDLTGWKIYLDKKDQDKDPAKFFTAEKDGVLKINGKVLGMIFTDKPFTNYTLSFDWLYPQHQRLLREGRPHPPPATLQQDLPAIPRAPRPLQRPRQNLPHGWCEG